MWPRRARYSEASLSASFPEFERFSRRRSQAAQQQLRSNVLPNVIQFRPRTPELTAVEPEPKTSSTSSVGIDPNLVDRMVALQARATTKVHRLILLLEIAIWNVREIAAHTHDPNVRNSILRQLTSIERMLEVARQKASSL